MKKMKMKKKCALYIVSCTLALFTCSCVNNNKSDMELLREKVGAQFISQNANESRVSELIQTINDDGSWPGINYVDTSNIAFQHTTHLNNMVQMALAYRKDGSGLKGDKLLKKAIDKSLDFWLKNDFLCENWWNNQVGTPTVMITLLYILDNSLEQDVINKMATIAQRANIDAPGARPGGDRIKICGLFAKTMIFQKKEKEFEEILKVIEGEMKFYHPEDAKKILNKNYYPSGNGLRSDYSFHHRPDQVNNTTTYGLDYLSYFIEFAHLVNDTKYKFSEEKLQMATDYFLDGICKQMVFGRSIDTGVLNRDISRRRRPNLADTSMPSRLLEISDYRKNELEDILHARKSEPFTPVSFAKFFWNTEHFAFQRPNYYTSVRMYSTRNRNMEEPYNGEGITNHYRADGTNYLSMDGSEYYNTIPVYNFRKIPGTTIVQVDTMPGEWQIQKRGLTDFVGGVTDGMYGAAVFDFKSPHNPLSAKKSWFFFDDYYVCLGASINSTDKFPVITTLNQCLLKGDVYVNDGKVSNVEKEGERYLSDIKWVFHNNTGYIFPKSQKIGLSNKTEQGSWARANRQTSVSKENIEEKMFNLWIDHGTKPANGKYEYIVIPATSIEKVENYVSTPPVTIISNTDKIQAVKNDNISYFVLYEPGEFTVLNDIKMSSNAPCMIMIKFKDANIQSITVSDPSRKLKTIELTINKNISTTNEKVTVKQQDKTTILSIQLSESELAGKSEVIAISN